MNFTPELLAFQGVLISTDSVYSYSKLTSRGGNEQKIQYVLDNILKFLEKDYITKSGVLVDKIKMRKLAFYLILNAELPVLEKMVDMEGLNSVIWTIPTLSKFLMCEMFWKFHMDQFLYEVIAFSDPQLGLEVTSSFIDNIKYFTPMECLDKLKLICTACYRSICRLHFFNFENNILSDLLTSMFDNLQRCLNYFSSPPNGGKLDSLKKDELYKHKGNCLHTMLSVICECVNQFTTTQVFAPDNFDDLYLLTYKEDSYSNDPLRFDTCNSPIKAILECLNKCHMVLLDKCQELVMDISVDIFCAWSEFEENGKSMQQTVGELSYKLRTKLLLIDVLSEHPVVSMIQQISHKPTELEEIINVTDSCAILENISNNSETRASWVRALATKDNLCCDNALVECLASNLKVLGEDNCYKLYKKCENYLLSHPDNAENVELLAIKTFQLCSNNKKYDILDERFSNKCFIDMTEAAEYDNMVAEIFNKLIHSPNADLYEIFALFLQSPCKTYTKIFNVATENSQQMGIMLGVMTLLEKYSLHYYNHETEACVIRIAKNCVDNGLDTEAKQHNFVNFICGLKNVNIIPGAKLLLLIIMPNLHKALLNKDICSINIVCKLLSQAYTTEELLEYRAPMLAMLAQLLDTLRWKMHSFDSYGPSTLQLALDLQTILCATYNSGGIPENEANWLRSKVKNLQPLNLYYYRKLWNLPSTNFVEVVSGMKVDLQMNMQQLAMWLSLMLCSSTSKEWCEVWNSLDVFGPMTTLDIFHNTLSLMTKAEVANREKNTWDCLLNCYKNFVFIIRYKFFDKPLSDDEVSAVIHKIADLANLLLEENMEDFGQVILPLLAYLVERKNDYTVDVAESLHGKMNHSKFADVVNKVFVNGTT